MPRDWIPSACGLDSRGRSANLGDIDRFWELDKGEPEGFRSTSRDFFDVVAFFRLEAESWLAKARGE